MLKRPGLIVAFRRAAALVTVLTALAAMTALAATGCGLGRRPPVKEPGEVTLVAAGDILLDRGVAAQTKVHGWSYPLARVASRLKSADLAFANLEGPITDRGVGLPKQFVFRAPPEAARALRLAGLDVLSVANNHTLDYGSVGLLDTLDQLNQESIAAVGAGKDAGEARRPKVVEADGIKLAFLAYNVFPNEVLAPVEDEPAVAMLEPRTLAEEIAAAKGLADVVVVSIHWGEEFSRVPTKGQRDLARAAIDAGAGLVLGHHPHVLQPLEAYHGGLIAYSLGNLVFDPDRPEAAQSALLTVRLSRSGVVGFDVEPLVIRAAQPRPAKGDEAAGVRAVLGP
ncbi:MAG TPA: CapA family protein [Bacillota bacterium]|jgi:poly-gamma-glutamate synthesis protein (capsule biosynthesis protein)